MRRAFIALGVGVITFFILSMLMTGSTAAAPLSGVVEDGHVYVKSVLKGIDGTEVAQRGIGGYQNDYYIEPQSISWGGTDVVSVGIYTDWEFYGENVDFDTFSVHFILQYYESNDYEYISQSGEWVVLGEFHSVQQTGSYTFPDQSLDVLVYLPDVPHGAFWLYYRLLASLEVDDFSGESHQDMIITDYKFSLYNSDDDTSKQTTSAIEVEQRETDDYDPETPTQTTDPLPPGRFAAASMFGVNAGDLLVPFIVSVVVMVLIIRSGGKKQ